MIKTYRYRIKGSTKALATAAKSVNFVWNYCNDIQKTAVSRGNKRPSGFDLCKLTSGSCRELGLSSRTVQEICQHYTQSRDQHKKRSLRYRGKKNLGWVPLKAEGFQAGLSEFTYMNRVYRVWNSRPIPENAVIKDGSSFSQDSKGNWYINVVVEIPETAAPAASSEVGIDLGLKDFAAFSDGIKVSAPQFYRKTEEKLGKAQRAHKKRQVKNLHTKIRNQRKDFLHKLSTQVVRDHGFIAVGDVNSEKLMQTKFSKSVTDAGWSAFRTMLKYKAIMHGATVIEVNERCSTVTCSTCLSGSGPQGIAGLRIREWKCGNCGSICDRDTNAAQNILRFGHEALAGGASSAVKAAEEMPSRTAKWRSK